MRTCLNRWKIVSQSGAQRADSRRFEKMGRQQMRSWRRTDMGKGGHNISVLQGSGTLATVNEHQSGILNGTELHHRPSGKREFIGSSGGGLRYRCAHLVHWFDPILSRHRAADPRWVLQEQDGFHSTDSH